jgi:hypothetical protein
MKTKIDEKILKQFACILWDKLNETADALEYYEDNTEIRQLLNEITKLSNAIHNEHDFKIKADKSRNILLNKLYKIKSES